MEWEIKIKKADNGYLLEWNEDSEDDEGNVNGKTLHTKVIEESELDNDDADSSEIVAMQKVLQEIKEFFGVNYSKHNRKNLIIEIEENKNEE